MSQLRLEQQVAVAELILMAQYYGALRYAADSPLGNSAVQLLFQVPFRAYGRWGMAFKAPGARST